MLLFHIGIFPAIGFIDNYIKVNEVLLNLSYSYLAGLVFYLINDGMPSLIKRIRANRLIGKHLCKLQSQLNYISSLNSFIHTQKLDSENKLYVEVSAHKNFKRFVDWKQINIDIEIDNTIANISCNLQAIESMLVSCYLSSDTVLLLSEIRACINFIEGGKDKIKNGEIIDRLRNISRKADNHFWPPETHKFRILTIAEASSVENSNRI